MAQVDVRELGPSCPSSLGELLIENHHLDSQTVADLHAEDLLAFGEGGNPWLVDDGKENGGLEGVGSHVTPRGEEEAEKIWYLMVLWR